MAIVNRSSTMCDKLIYLPDVLSFKMKSAMTNMEIFHILKKISLVNQIIHDNKTENYVNSWIIFSFVGFGENKMIFIETFLSIYTSMFYSRSFLPTLKMRKKQKNYRKHFVIEKKKEFIEY